MIKHQKSTAEAKFAELTAREAEAFKARQSEARKRSDKVDRLKALRLAKEAADAIAAEEAAAAKRAAVAATAAAKRQK